MSNYSFLIGIGAQKAGTSWIDNYLSSYDEICVSRIKELHYFDAKFIQEKINTKFQNRYDYWRNKSKTNPVDRTLLTAFEYRLKMTENFDQYLKYFDFILTNEKIACEITPGYSQLDTEGFSFMKNNVPNLKILFIMRNPADRFWSQLRFQNLSVPNLDKLGKLLNNYRFTERGNYKRIIENLEQVFDKIK